jgi:hypothetical protein
MEKSGCACTEQGLPQAAQKEVDKIYAQTKKDGNDVQGLKALIYSKELAQHREEDDFEKNIGRLRRK